MSVASASIFESQSCMQLQSLSTFLRQACTWLSSLGLTSALSALSMSRCSTILSMMPQVWPGEIACCIASRSYSIVFKSFRAASAKALQGLTPFWGAAPIVVLAARSRLAILFWQADFVQVKNSVGDDVREGVRVTSLHTEELKDSRGTANFALKWVKDSRKAAYLNVVPIKNLTRHMTENDDLEWVPFIAFDCRGLDVIGFHPEVNFCSPERIMMQHRNFVTERAWTIKTDQATIERLM